jgi:ankyrin repeat protein
MVQWLLEHGATLQEKTIYGYTALDQALRNNHSTVVDYLRSLNAASQTNTKAKSYPLHHAVIHDYPAFSKLLESAAMVDIRPNEDGNIPLHLAAGFGRSKEVELLLNKFKEIMVNQKSKYGCTPLHLAIRRCNLSNPNADTKTIILLLQYGANPNLGDNEGNNILHLGILCGADAKVIEILLQAGASPIQCNGQGKTPLELAKIATNSQVVALLTPSPPQAPITAMCSNHIVFGDNGFLFFGGNTFISRRVVVKILDYLPQTTQQEQQTFSGLRLVCRNWAAFFRQVTDAIPAVAETPTQKPPLHYHHD